MTAQVEAWKTWAIPDPGTALWEWQQSRCAWCGHEDELVTDHCHLTGLVRGLLCRACNVREGYHFGNLWDGWRTGDNPAATLGQFEIYENIHGQTPTSPQSSLHYYSHVERKAWFVQIVQELTAGAPWPMNAPWTEVARSRKDEEEELVRGLLDVAFGWMSNGLPTERPESEAS